MNAPLMRVLLAWAVLAGVEAGGHPANPELSFWWFKLGSALMVVIILVMHLMWMVSGCRSHAARTVKPVRCPTRCPAQRTTVVRVAYAQTLGGGQGEAGEALYPFPLTTFNEPACS